MVDAVPAPVRLVDAFKRLATSAQSLSFASDEFAKPIARIDAVLKQLNLGLIAWEKIQGGEDEDENYWSHDVGYAKVDDVWGLAIRSRQGNHQIDEAVLEEWLFNSAPRPLRIDAIDKVPALLEKLITAAEKTAKKLREKTAEAHDLAAALAEAASEISGKEQPQKARTLTDAVAMATATLERAHRAETAAITFLDKRSKERK
jgi:hypothetical protein